MKKGEFDLTGKAIDCSGLPAMGDAGKEIFRALKAECNGVDDKNYGIFDSILNPVNRYLIISGGVKLFSDESGLSYFKLEAIQPSDVLGQAAINAAMDGATLVFEGDDLPDAEMTLYQCTGQSFISNGGYSIGGTSMAIAYKLLEEKQPTFTTTSPVQQMHEQLGMSKPAFDKALAESLKHELPSIQSRVLSEKMGFKELCPVCSPKDWEDREAETYDEMRDAHLELVRENMLLVKENEALAQRIKNLHRAINDAKACLDE